MEQCHNLSKKRILEASPSKAKEPVITILGMNGMALQKYHDGTVMTPLAYLTYQSFLMVTGQCYEARALLAAFNIGETTINDVLIPYFPDAFPAKFRNKESCVKILGKSDLPLAKELRRRGEVINYILRNML